MTGPATPLSREERLAARLRDNLRRRKAQARAFDAQAIDAQADAPTAGNNSAGDKSDLPKPGDGR